MCDLAAAAAVFAVLHCSLQIIGVDNNLFLLDIGVLVAMYFASCIFVIGVLGWRHRVRNG